MKDIYLLQGFNNYFNRKVKYLADLESYKSAAEYDSFPNVNFNPGDGVKTTHIVGGQTQILSGIPDYVLIVKEDGETIESRWFVIEADYQRNGQYKLGLKRDVLADHYDELLYTPIFVEKGSVGVENPLIFNNEGNKFNQIKKSEHLLKDETGTNWIVGYIAQDTKETPDITSALINTNDFTEIGSLDIDLVDEAHPENGGTFTELGGDVTFEGELGFMNYANTYPTHNTQVIKAHFNGEGISHYNGTSLGKWDPFGTWNFGYLGTGAFGNVGGIPGAEALWGKVFKEHYQSIMKKPFINYLTARNQEPISLAQKNKILALNGKKVFSSISGKYYTLVVGGSEKSSYDFYAKEAETTAIFAAFNTMKKYFVAGIPSNLWRDNFNGDPYRVTYSLKKTTISFVETSGPGTIRTTISANRQHLTDAPFDMFAIPFTLDNLNLATQINLKLGQGVYDIQILPYCPVRKLVTPNGIDLSLGIETTDYDLITTADEAATQVSYILWASTSSDSFVIYHKIPAAVDPIELKVQNECDMYRITSPNYNGSFEFSVAKNRGVDYFEVNYTYKPYSPYIHVCPNFKGLYGQDFDDARGLICNGDFSIAMTSDAWRTYEISNKNYQNIFDTQIKTMDKLHGLEMGSQAVASILGAATTGAGIGILSGNAKFGVGMAGASLGAGIADLIISEEAYKTNRNAKTAMYNYELGNIKARPDSLTKISAYNINNKYFPFVEHYSATEVEKEALRNKIKYDGMTIMAIGQPIDYIGTGYFKGKLIRCETIKDDSHIVNDIYNELNQGVYLNG